MTEKINETEIINKYKKYQQQMKNIATQMADLEADADEHKLVIETMKPLNSDRKCFRLIGGILVERTFKEVLPALEKNFNQIQEVVKQLLESYKKVEIEFNELKEKHNIKIEPMA